MIKSLSKPLTHEPSFGISGWRCNTSSVPLLSRCFRVLMFGSMKTGSVFNRIITYCSDQTLSHSGFIQHPAACPWVVQKITSCQSVRPRGLKMQASRWPAFPRTHMRCEWIQMFALGFFISLLQHTWVISSYPGLTVRFTPERQDCSRGTHMRSKYQNWGNATWKKVPETKGNLFVVLQSMQVRKIL